MIVNVGLLNQIPLALQTYPFVQKTIKMNFNLKVDSFNPIK